MGNLVEQSEDKRVKVQHIQHHDAGELYAQLLSWMIVLDDTERFKDHGEEERDERHDDGDFVPSPPGVGLFDVHRAFHNQNDLVRGDH